MTDDLPRPAPDVVSRRLQDEIVLVHMKTNRIYALNETGARFWELLVEGFKREEVEERLRSEFDVDEARVRAEIDALLAELTRENIVVERSPR
jgi:hypothetical protein